MSAPSKTSGQREVLKKLYEMVNCRSLNDQSKSWRDVRALGYVRIQFEETRWWPLDTGDCFLGLPMTAPSVP